MTIGIDGGQECIHLCVGAKKPYILYLGLKAATLMTSSTTLLMARELKKASKSNDAPLWMRLSREALKPSIARRTININKINKLTKEGDVVFFAGKILGTGNLDHSITISSFAISSTAARKIQNAGGKFQNYKIMIQNNPAGKDVILLG